MVFGFIWQRADDSRYSSLARRFATFGDAVASVTPTSTGTHPVQDTRGRLRRQR